MDSVDDLSKAYPNYYLDSRAFIRAVEREIGKSFFLDKRTELNPS